MRKLFFIFLISIGIFSAGVFLISPTHALAVNIDPAEPNHWAWNDAIGWIDFCGPVAGACDPVSINVSNAKLSGSASSSIGFIVTDCATSPNGNICGTSNFVISNNQGVLSGFAWNDAIGWISFNCADISGACAVSPYSVTIATTTNTGLYCQSSPAPECGEFHGWAWNDIVGWISFNCTNESSCGTVDYKVRTTWTLAPPLLSAGSLISPIFNMCPSGTCGAAVNSIMWKGSENNGAVTFQIATECSTSQGTPPNCTGGGNGWNFLGPDGTANTGYGPVAPNTIMNISLRDHNNKQYVRYKISLSACNPPTCSSPQSPQVDDVIINWSP